MEKLFVKIEDQLNQNILLLRAKKNLLYRICLAIVKNRLFSIIVVLSIIGNAVVLSMDHYPIDQDFENTLESFNLTFFTIFVVELILKLIAFGVRYYFKDKFNWFDSGVVVVSCIDVILTYS